MNAIICSQLPQLFEVYSAAIEQVKDILTELDGRLGDGDLGVNLSLGYRAVCDDFQLNPPISLSAAYQRAGMVFNRAAPSTLGTLLSVSMLAASNSLLGLDVIDIVAWRNMMRAGQDAMLKMGRSNLGDKTILDAWAPYVDALSAAQSDMQDLPGAAARALLAAEDALERIKQMPARIGRAAMFGDQAIGHPDGGAVAFVALMKGFCRFVSS